jgi:hypothetical protein
MNNPWRVWRLCGRILCGGCVERIKEWSEENMGTTCHGLYENDKRQNPCLFCKRPKGSNTQDMSNNCESSAEDLR